MTSAQQKSYVVEHMEPEMGAWSTLEYIAIANESVQAGSRFYLTSLQRSLAGNLPDSLWSHVDGKQVVATSTEISALEDVEQSRVCLLDPQAPQELMPEDGDRFDWFVFGGILGDDPPRDRTAELRKYGYEGRSLRKIQMTTDTAVRVTRMVVQGKQCLSDIQYVDYPELKINQHEFTEMPFRYVKGAKSEPIMPEGMVELIKKDADKSLDDLF